VHTLVISTQYSMCVCVCVCIYIYIYIYICVCVCVCVLVQLQSYLNPEILVVWLFSDTVHHIHLTQCTLFDTILV
jgi:hypothetical protein